MTVRIGAMFAGYSGIELGLAQVIDCEPAWFVENDPAASKVLAYHWPHVPNLGDVTRIEWATVERSIDEPMVDILTGGVPCQDVSHAGKRAGMRAGTRTGLWSAMRDAIAVLRPPLVVFENVRGILSADADSDSDLEPCPGCVGDPDDEPVLRALGRVLGDLADLGFDARWYGLRAADVGAAHNRFRIFVFAAPADTEGIGSGSSWAGSRGPRWADGVSGSSQRALVLLPTPTVNDMGAGKTVEQWDEWTEKMQAKHGNGNGHGPSLAIEAARLLPTLRATDGTKGGPGQRGSSGDLMLPSAVQFLPTPTAMDSRGSGGKGGGPNVTLTDATVRNTRPWAQYEAAIRRHEAALGRPAPAPTEPGRNGPRLSPAFVEWLMMLPAGHVTDPAIRLTRNEQLRVLGNGVVPNQCAAAFRQYLHDESSTTVTTCL